MTPWTPRLDKQRKDVGMYPFEVIGRMRDVDPPSTGYYHYPATGEIVRVQQKSGDYDLAVAPVLTNPHRNGGK